MQFNNVEYKKISELGSRYRFQTRNEVVYLSHLINKHKYQIHAI